MGRSAEMWQDAAEQQQYEANVMGELYVAQAYAKSKEHMALTICTSALKDVQAYPRSPLNEWNDGRVCAAALICDTPEVQSLRNQVVFLNRRYNRRHFGEAL